MNKIKRILFFGLTLISSFAADSYQRRAGYMLTDLPSAGDSFTVNGDTRTFQSSVTSASTQVQIGASIGATATNIATTLGLYGITNTIVAQTTTNIAIIGTLRGGAMAASLSGTWGVVTLYTNTANSRPFMIPQSGEVAAGRVTNVDDLISSFAYGSAQLPANSPPMANFASLSANQTFIGPKQFPAATIQSNAASLFTLGYISNAFAREIKLTYNATTNVGIVFMNNAGTAKYAIVPSITAGGASGTPQLREISGHTIGIGANYSPDGADILNAGIADTRYSQLAGFNWFQGASNQFDGVVYLTNFFGGVWSGGGQVTNGTAAFFTNLYGNSLSVAGNAGLTSSAPAITFYDTGGTLNKKQAKLIADGDEVAVSFYTDAGVISSTPFEIQRDQALFNVELFAEAGMTVEGGDFKALGGNIDTSAALVSGSTTPTLPGGMSTGVYLMDGTDAVADPITGLIIYSVGGIPKYRTSLSGEGGGGNFYLHARTATVQGVGTDYTFTTSAARLAFGTTATTFTAPTAGEYWITADISITNAGTDYDEYHVKLRNETTSTDVPYCDQVITHLPANKQGCITITGTMTLAASDVVGIWGFNNTAARGTANAVRTRIRYIRLH